MKIKSLLCSAGLASLALMTTACGGGGGGQTAVAPPPPPTQTGSSLDVSRCLNQTVGGRRVLDILVPDVLDLDLSRPSGFPNGRDLDDPVIDLTLAVIFLDLSRHGADTFVRLPVNPDRFDQPLRTEFPFYAAPLGNPPIADKTGSNFNFRTDPPSAYTRLDRAGLPAVSTATVLGTAKLTYNDSNPTIDATGANVPLILEGYQALTNALNDDFKGLGLTPCAT